MRKNLLYWAALSVFLIAMMLFEVFVMPKTNYLSGWSVNGFSDPFPFANVPGMAREWYIYYGIEHYLFVATFLMFWKETGNEVMKWFFWIQFFDMTDYLLTYNEVYFYFLQVPVSFNIISFCLWMYFGVNLFWGSIKEKHF